MFSKSTNWLVLHTLLLSSFQIYCWIVPSLISGKEPIVSDNNHSIQSVEVYEKELAKVLEIYGPAHPKVADTWFNLGHAWKAKGEIEKAIESYAKTLDIDIKVHGMDGPSIDRGLEGIESMLDPDAKGGMGLEFWEIAVPIIIKVLGPKHVLSIYFKDAIRFQEDIAARDEAFEHNQKELENSLAKYGPDHPEVSKLWIKLGLAWREKGRVNKAINFFDKALVSDLKTFGPDDPRVARIWNNLGLAWKAKRKYEKAIGYFNKALASDLKSFGPDHQLVARSWSDLGLSWQGKTKNDKAIEYFEMALASDLKSFGDEHENVASGWYNLGISWFLKGDYTKTINYFEKTLASHKKIFGQNDIRVVDDLDYLGVIWHFKGKYNKAIEYYEKSMAVMELLPRFQQQMYHHTYYHIKERLEEAEAKKGPERFAPFSPFSNEKLWN
ncbi:MAG: tetratricopeptide repeat protein [Nitrospinales bacterium]